MKFGVTYDADSEAGLDDVVYPLLNAGFESHFSGRFYDDSGTGLFLVLMCRDPIFDLKQRIRFLKKKNTLYMDIMLDLNEMSRANPTTRKSIAGEKIVKEVPQIVAKYKFTDFDLPRFSADLREWFEQHGWISPIFPEEEIYFER